MAQRRFALLVGTGTYADSDLGALRAPSTDVTGLADVLADPKIGRFQVRGQLVDAPRGEIQAAIEEFFVEDVRPDDLRLLYISGHGVQSSRRRLYLATRDTKRERLASSAIEASWVQARIDECRCRSIVLVLDCCHSGAFEGSLRHKGDTDAGVEAELGGQGHVTLTASTELEYAFEHNRVDDLGAMGGSVFTRHLIEGLRSGEADLDGDGRISIGELYDFVYRRMKTSTVPQSPKFLGEQRGDVFVAYRGQSQVGLPPEVRALLRSSSPVSRLAGVAALTEIRTQRGHARAVDRALQDLAKDADPRVVVAARDARARGRSRRPREAPAPPAHATAPVAAPAPIRLRAAPDLRVAATHEAKGRWARALASYDAALKTHPDHLDAVLGRSRALLALGRLDDATDGFSLVLASATEDVLALLGRARAHRRNGKTKAALLDATKAAQRAPRSSEALVELGWSRLAAGSGHRKAALAAFKKAGDLDRGSARAFAGRAVARLLLGHLQEARAAVGRALHLEPGLPEALAAEAGLRMLSGDTLALRALKQARIGCDERQAIDHLIDACRRG